MLPTFPVAAQSEAGDAGEGADGCSPKDQKNADEDPEDESDPGDPDESGDEDGGTPDQGPDDSSGEGAPGDTPGNDTVPEAGDIGSGDASPGDVSGTDGDGNDGGAGAGLGDYDIYAGGGAEGGGWGGGGGGGSSRLMEIAADPIDLRLADKQHVQVDYAGAGSAPLRWARVYHSNRAAFQASNSQPMGAGWRGSYDRSIQTLSANSVRLHRANGATLDYGFNGSSWVSPGSGGTLTRLFFGEWQYINHHNAIETYSASGRLLGITRRGLTTSLSYDGAGRLSVVTNPFGRSLRFGYDASNRLSSVTLPGGGTLGYGYDGTDRLVSVRFADNSVRQYLYENTSFPNALTGVIDESGRRRLTWGYDSMGRPNYGHYGAGVNAVGVVYSGDTVTTSDVRGIQRVRTFGVAGNRRVLTTLQTAATNDAAATAWSFSYDGNGQLAGVATRTGESRVHSFDRQGRMLSGTRAAGTGIAKTVQHTWHPVFRVPTQTISAGVTTNRSIDGHGRITQVIQTGIDGTNRTLALRTYNAQGLLNGVTNARGATTGFGYDVSGNLISRTDGQGRVTSFSGHDAHGRPTQIIRPDGTVISRSYDMRGRLASRTRAGVTTYFSYDNANRLLQVTRPNGSWRRRAYDTAGQLASITNHRGESVVYSRDVDGKVTGRATYTAAGVVAQRSNRQFDSRGRLAAWLDSRGYKTTAAYAADARLASITDPLGRSRSTGYDLLDRTLMVSQPNTTAARLAGGAATVASTHIFDPSFGRHLQTTDTVNVATNFGHDAFHRKVADTGADAGGRSWVRNAAGDIVSYTDARGVVTAITRDSLGRITQLAPSAGAVTTISYVAGRSDNLPASTTDGAGTTSWRYDNAGRLLSKTQAVGGYTRTLGLTRDAVGRVSAMTYPSGLVVGYVYDADRVSAITVGGSTVITNIGYLPRSSTATGWRWSTGAVHNRRFDADGRLTQVTLGPVTRSLGYDAAGRVTAVQDVGGSNSGNTALTYDEAGQLTAQVGPAGSFGYAYDSNGNRLSQVINGTTKVNTFAAGSNRIVSSPNGRYTYDAVGNPTSDGYYSLIYDTYGRLTTFSSPRDYRVSRSFNAQGLRVMSSAATWITAGDLRGAPAPQAAVTTAIGTKAQLPTRTPQASVTGVATPNQPAPLHAAFQTGRLPAQLPGTSAMGIGGNTPAGWATVDTRQFFYDDTGHLLGEYQTAGGSYKQETVWFNGMPVAAVINGVTYLVSADHLGTPRSLQRASDGVEVWRWDGEPFGSSYPSIYSVQYNLRFPGQVYDAQTGYHYNWMREYNPVTGRYLQPDPIGLAGGLSRYSYAVGDPVLDSDLTGEASWIGAIFGGALAGYGLFRVLDKQNSCEEMCQQTQGIEAVKSCGNPERQDEVDARSLDRVQACKASCAMGSIMTRLLPGKLK